MRRLPLIFCVAAAALSALLHLIAVGAAQAPAQPPAHSEPPAAAQQMSVAFEEVEKLTARIMALGQRLAELDAYLKRCADQPGCTVPVPVPAGPK